jgi:uncharacterized membrane protein
MDKALKKIIWFTIPAPAIYLAFIWNRLPETIPLHYNLQGEVNRYGSKNELLLVAGILIALSLFLYLIIANIYRIDPKKYAPENKSRFFSIAFSVSVFISAILCIIIYTSQHEDTKTTTRLMLAAAGLLFTILGNYLHTIKPNYFAGIRLPWTLENEDNWRKTHLLAGKLFFAAGFLILLVSFIVPVTAIYAVFTGIIVVICLIPCIYSFLLYRKQKQLSRSNK